MTPEHVEKMAAAAWELIAFLRNSDDYERAQHRPGVRRQIVDKTVEEVASRYSVSPTEVRRAAFFLAGGEAKIDAALESGDGPGQAFKPI